MATYNFTDSIVPAITFATKLLAGTLNLQIDYEQENCPLVDLTHETGWFSTDIMEVIRALLNGYEMSRLEATDVAENPDCRWGEGKIRHVAVFAKDRSGKEQQIATFDVETEFLDGERAVGWTRWHVTNVQVMLDVRMVDEPVIKLVPEQVDRHDDFVVWGRIVRP